MRLKSPNRPVECGFIFAGVTTNTLSWFLVATATSAIWGVISLVCTADALTKRGIPVKYPMLGLLLVFRYLPQYRAIMLQETGRAGPLFYSFIVAMNLALVAVALAWVTHRW